jgi:DNA-directed RNA polymerase subunit K/omega
MDPLNEEPVEQQEGPQVPAEPAPPINSRFLFVDVAALRAKQLRRGARVRFDDADAPVRHASRKPERVAMEEVRRGLVYYDVPAAKPPSGDGDTSSGARGFSRPEA